MRKTTTNTWNKCAGTRYKDYRPRKWINFNENNGDVKTGSRPAGPENAPLVLTFSWNELDLCEICTFEFEGHGDGWWWCWHRNRRKYNFIATISSCSRWVTQKKMCRQPPLRNKVAQHINSNNSPGLLWRPCNWRKCWHILHFPTITGERLKILRCCSAQLCCNESNWMRSSVFCKLATLLYMGECWQYSALLA